ncbi:MAG: SDR family NAD(P)-dependent oxidoreductase [Spirochaetales bacterium]|nr:SDR family NAD(P)-dependent oxidoreductase [Spirochaetales bacterium]
MSPSPLALVTGGSSGIGEALAEGLARRGYDLLLVSENARELRRARERLGRMYPVDVRARVQDLSRPGAAEALVRFCQDATLPVEVLVNAAGDYLTLEHELARPEAVSATVVLHVLTPTRLCLQLGQEMVQRGKGFILNISSISALFPDFASVTYGSAKSYLRHLSTVLHCEWRRRGVAVTCVLPGGVRTNLFRESGVYVPGLVRRHLLSPEACAELSLEALFRGRRELIPGGSGKLQALLFRLIVRPATYDALKSVYAALARRESPEQSREPSQGQPRGEPQPGFEPETQTDSRPEFPELGL